MDGASLLNCRVTPSSVRPHPISPYAGGEQSYRPTGRKRLEGPRPLALRNATRAHEASLTAPPKPEAARPRAGRHLGNRLRRRTSLRNAP
jgi:hypothetical protein